MVERPAFSVICQLTTAGKKGHIPLRSFKSMEEKNERAGHKWLYHPLELHKPGRGLTTEPHLHSMQCLRGSYNRLDEEYLRKNWSHAE